jgi:predicted DNA-binding transcriptional regulator AlpA
MATLIDRLLTPEETARYLRYKAQTLAFWRMKRMGPRFVKTGHSVRYRVSDLEDWIERRTVTTGTEED